MGDKKFMIFIYGLLTVMVLLTMAHLAYIYNAYQHSSIIYFIAKELW